MGRLPVDTYLNVKESGIRLQVGFLCVEYA